MADLPDDGWKRMKSSEAAATFAVAVVLAGPRDRTNGAVVADHLAEAYAIVRATRGALRGRTSLTDARRGFLTVRLGQEGRLEYREDVVHRRPSLAVGPSDTTPAPSKIDWVGPEERARFGSDPDGDSSS